MIDDYYLINDEWLLGDGLEARWSWFRSLEFTMRSLLGCRTASA